MNAEEIRNEIRQIIRMLEDSVIVGSDNHLYLLIGKLVVLQAKLDELEAVEERWFNDAEI